MDQFLEGFALQASLILALGAQNIFVLESGLKKRRHLLVATVCSICDTILIAAGVLGAASLFVRFPSLKITFGVLGVSFLAFYGLKKIYESFEPSLLEVKITQSTHSVKKVILLALGFSLLNPHVYLDTIILIGGYAAQFGELSQRISFGIGTATFSVLWFFGLALFAQAMSKFLDNPRSMRIVSFISGVILLFLTWKLGSDVFAWL